MVNGFHRGGETIRHLWGAELTSGPSDAEQDHLSVGTLEPLWNLLTSRGRSARPTGTSRSATHRPSRSALTAATSAADDRTSAAGRNGSQPASAVRVIASVSPRAPNAVPPDEQQLYGGTQSALSTTLLLWRSSAGADGAPIVEKEHSQLTEQREPFLCPGPDGADACSRARPLKKSDAPPGGRQPAVVRRFKGFGQLAATFLTSGFGSPAGFSVVSCRGESQGVSFDVR
jgi:hypothetical protein